MPYRFARDARDHRDLASGQVLRSAPGQAAFPVRLAREMYEQAAALAPPAPHVIYDPCCGAGHLLTSLGFLYGSDLARVIGSDVDAGVLPLARQNLALLTPEGLAARTAELRALHDRHGRHQGAVASAQALAASLAAVDVSSFEANALDPAELAAGLGPHAPDIVVADTPYGRLSTWKGDPTTNSAAGMLAALAEVLRPGAVLAIGTDNHTKVEAPLFRRVRQMRAGHRRITWLVHR
jgi:tRNA G10  N-methylase Trm11